MTDLRAADPFRQDKSRPFSSADRSSFLDALEREVRLALKAAK
ncbi:MAG: YaiI/YqxD family protein, partial [Alphaproteobacteria bacterium]